MTKRIELGEHDGFKLSFHPETGRFVAKQNSLVLACHRNDVDFAQMWAPMLKVAEDRLVEFFQIVK